MDAGHSPWRTTEATEMFSHLLGTLYKFTLHCRNDGQLASCKSTMNHARSKQDAVPIIFRGEPIEKYLSRSTGPEQSDTSSSPSCHQRQYKDAEDEAIASLQSLKVSSLKTFEKNAHGLVQGAQALRRDSCISFVFISGEENQCLAVKFSQVVSEALSFEVWVDNIKMALKKFTSITMNKSLSATTKVLISRPSLRIWPKEVCRKRRYGEACGTRTGES